MEIFLNTLGLLLVAVLLVVIALRIQIGDLVAENSMLRGQLDEVRKRLEVLRDDLQGKLDGSDERVVRDFVEASARAYKSVKEKNEALDLLKEVAGVNHD